RCSFTTCPHPGEVPNPPAIGTVLFVSSNLRTAQVICSLDIAYKSFRVIDLGATSTLPSPQVSDSKDLRKKHGGRGTPSKVYSPVNFVPKPTSGLPQVSVMEYELGVPHPFAVF